MKYSIFDPTGNITALVESEVDPAMQPAAAAGIMNLHGNVEQVGFVRLPDEKYTDEIKGVCAELRMAGGEFCGNASMCAAAWYLLRNRQPDGSAQPEEETVLLRVSGVNKPVEVRLKRMSEYSFDAGICMPPALYTERVKFSAGGLNGTLPVVHMEGISHIIIEEDTGFLKLKEDPQLAEITIPLWCRVLEADGLGLMFLEKDSGSPEIAYRLTPLVYIPGSDTKVWENSCASGTSAAGMFLAERAGRISELSFSEPGGTLLVRSDPRTDETWLYGKVAFHPSLSYTQQGMSLSTVQ